MKGLTCSLLLVWTACTARARGALLAELNVNALNQLIDSIRSDVLPGLVGAVNRRSSLLNLKVQVGSCCSAGDVGSALSLSLSNLRLADAFDVSVVTLDTGSGAAAPPPGARIRFQATNAAIETALSSQFSIAYGAGETGCAPVVVAAVGLPRVSIGVGMDAQGGGSAFRVALVNVQIEPLTVQLRVDDRSGVCGALVARLADTVNTAASRLSTLLTARFNEESAGLLANLTAIVPVAYDAPIPLRNGNLVVDLGLQVLRTTSARLVTAVGASFSGVLTAPAYRSGYSYTPTVTEAVVATAAPPSNRLLSLSLDAPAVNNFLQASWYLVWSGIATDDQSATAPDFCKVPTPTDPCPFPPARVAPGLFNALLLRAAFFFNTGFFYQAVLEPPSLRLFNGTLGGRITSTVALRGRRWRSSTMRTLALFEADLVAETGVPGYDRDTGIVQFSGFALRIENTRAKVVANATLGTSLVTAAAGVLNNLVANRLLGPLNRLIQDGLNKVPIKFPSIRGLPLSDRRIDFTFPNAGVSVDGGYLGITSDFAINVVQTSGGASALAAPAVAAAGGAPPVVAAAANANALFFSGYYDSVSGEMDVRTFRTTNGVVEELVNGAWI